MLLSCVLIREEVGEKILLLDHYPDDKLTVVVDLDPDLGSGWD